MTGKKVNRPKIRRFEVKEHMAPDLPHIFETTQLASLLDQQRTEVFDKSCTVFL